MSEELDLEPIKARLEAVPPFGDVVNLDQFRDDQLTYFKTVDGEMVYTPAFTIEGVESLGNHESGAMEESVAEFIQQARNVDIPALIAEVERLRAENDETMKVVDDQYAKIADLHKILRVVIDRWSLNIAVSSSIADLHLNDALAKEAQADKMNVQEVADYLSIDVDQVSALLQAGKLPSLFFYDVWLYKLDRSHSQGKGVTE